MHSVRLTGTTQYPYSLTRKLDFIWQGAQIKVCISTPVAARCGQVIKFWRVIMFLLLQHMRWKVGWVFLKGSLKQGWIASKDLLLFSTSSYFPRRRDDWSFSCCLGQVSMCLFFYINITLLHVREYGLPTRCNFTYKTICIPCCLNYDC